MHNEKDGFPITALREIKLLKILSHPNILQLQEMAVERSRGEGRKKPSMYMVTPYMEHDLSGLLENPDVQFSEPQIKCYMIQLLKGLQYLHENRILHRDMKAANLLINNAGVLQIADFGLARPYDEAPPVAGKGGGEAKREYTTLVVTRWYRPPELLLQLRRYTTAIDLWGAGCVFGEMFKGKPILAGSSDLNQAQLIFNLVGSPTEENMPGWSALPGAEPIRSFGFKRPTLATVFQDQGPVAISLLTELLRLDWRKRINAIDALKHPYFTTPPLPARPGDIPSFEDSHELDRRKFRGQKAALPPAPAGGKAESQLQRVLAMEVTCPHPPDRHMTAVADLIQFMVTNEKHQANHMAISQHGNVMQTYHPNLPLQLILRGRVVLVGAEGPVKTKDAIDRHRLEVEEVSVMEVETHQGEMERYLRGGIISIQYQEIGTGDPAEAGAQSQGTVAGLVILVRSLIIYIDVNILVWTERLHFATHSTTKSIPDNQAFVFSIFDPPYLFLI
ncbi:CMGC/CDK protein kinase [Arthroderma uncinatum]|uniref:CMGC/CDK protein kinase n=1 Tax=Arthroderma uncinatum TaxID=74035 RepID=UPI00144AD361|nr:CMGC/CDK protein kinase [Arthroderma uncinatum]KAF3479585.1 CMGC/CDK protein kinase [Arthroderma uncinatum]